MDTNNILRLALMLGGNQAQNFTTNLKKIVKLVLFDNYSTAISVDCIIRKISEQYFLVFTDSEIVESIKNDKGIITGKKEDSSDTLYSITPEEYQKISIKQTSNIDDYVKEFLKEGKCESISFSALKELIFKYLYFTFNSDVKTMMQFLSPNIGCNKNFFQLNTEFSPDEANIINSFLNWDNKNKNEYILNMVSACFDYCMLTVKKDSTSFAQVFKGKEFYLDSNVIFRLAGFNKIERKQVLDAFVKKCKNAGIKICYTNQTKAELKSTLLYYVDDLRKLLGNQKPVSIDAMKALSSKYSNLDFYEQYSEWCKNLANKPGDFKAFSLFLERKIDKVLSPFSLVVTRDYTMLSSRKNFKELVEDFTLYKSKHYRNTYEGAIKTDISNYMFMCEKNNNGQAGNFMNIKHFFITADHCLTEWSSQKRPGVVPIFVLPSVWYSVLLKYEGRTEDDYKAFCQFLNIRIAPEQDSSLVHKKAMLAHILELNEECEIKEKIIFDVESRLQSQNVNIEDPIEFVEESHKTILQEKLDENTQVMEKKRESEIKKVKETSKEFYEKEIQILNKKHSEDLKNENLKGQAIILKKQAKQIIKRNKTLHAVGLSLYIGCIILTIMTLIAVVFKQPQLLGKFPDWYEKNEAWIWILGVFIIVLKIPINIIFNKFNLLSVNEEYIIKKLKDKYKLKQ